MLLLDNADAVENTETFTLVAEAAYLTVHNGNAGPVRIHFRSLSICLP